jgi:predicted GNAT superfamily acetyltransferase
MIREYKTDDADKVLAINAACVPEVGTMNANKLALFVELSPFFKVIELDARVVGFLIGLTELSTQYTSPNYVWFSKRHERFAYIDRIAIAEEGRGQGWGQKLYNEFESWARDQNKQVLAAEVNTIPDNPPSHRFHQAFGFVDVKRTYPYGPKEEVAMYEKVLA